LSRVRKDEAALYTLKSLYALAKYYQNDHAAGEAGARTIKIGLYKKQQARVRSIAGECNIALLGLHSSVADRKQVGAL